jgi:hypothetical protein
MHDFWDFLARNDARNAIAIAAIVISAAIAITLFRLNRKRKTLVYEYLSMSRLVSLPEQRSGRIRVLVDETPVMDVGLVQIGILNSGTDPIKAIDFVRPVSFSVAAPARIVEASISEENPPTIAAELEVDDHRATLAATLLNAGDSLVLKLLIADFDGAISIDARIEGVELKRRGHLNGYLRDSKWAPVFRFAIEILSAFGGLGAITALQLKSWDRDFPNDYRRSGKSAPKET